METKQIDTRLVTRVRLLGSNLFTYSVWEQNDEYDHGSIQTFEEFPYLSERTIPGKPFVNIENDRYGRLGTRFLPSGSPALALSRGPERARLVDLHYSAQFDVAYETIREAFPHINALVEVRGANGEIFTEEK